MGLNVYGEKKISPQFIAACLEFTFIADIVLIETKKNHNPGMKRSRQDLGELGNISVLPLPENSYTPKIKVYGCIACTYFR